MKALSCCAAALLMTASIVRAGPIDPLGPELPLDIPTAGLPYDLSGLGDVTDPADVLPAPSSVDDLLSVEFQLTDNVTNGVENFTDEFEVPISGSGYLFELPSPTGADSYTLSNVGFLLSPTLIPLEDLNYSGPGGANPGYTPLPAYDGATLPSGGGTLDILIPTPLPTAGWGLAVCLGLVAVGKRRRPATTG